MNFYCRHFPDSHVCIRFLAGGCNEGSVYDSRHMSCVGVFVNADVLGPISGCRTSHNESLASNRIKCLAVSEVTINTLKESMTNVIICRSIGITWLLITITAIPVLFSHGEFVLEYYGSEEVKCAFLSEEGYNHPAFQVSNIV